MKKRRDLDALVNGKAGPGRRKKKGQHELLRNESDSSEIEEFSIPQKTIVRNGQGTCRLCAKCLTVCGFILLTACVAAVAALVWLNVEMKKEVDLLKSRLDTVASTAEDNKLTSVRLDGLIKSLEEQQQTQGDQINKLQTDISTCTTQLSNMNKTLKEVSKGLKEAPQLQALPQQVKQLSEQFANFGSDTHTFQVSTTNRLEILEAKISDSSDEDTLVKTSTTANPSRKSLRDNVNDDQVVSLRAELSDMKTHSQMHTLAIAELRNKTLSLDERLGLAELSMTGEADFSKMEPVIQAAVQSALAEMSNVSLGQADSASQERTADLQRQLKNVSADLKRQLNNVSADLLALKGSLQQNEADDGMMNDMQYAMNSTLERLRIDIIDIKAVRATDMMHANASYVALEQRLGVLEAATPPPSADTRKTDAPAKGLPPFTSSTTSTTSKSTTSAPKKSPADYSDAPYDSSSDEDDSYGSKEEGSNPEDYDAYDYQYTTLSTLEMTTGMPAVNLDIDGIVTMADLDKWIASVDTDGDKRLSYDDIQKALGPDNTPPRMLMRMFDVQADGFYDRLELAVALNLEGSPDTFRPEEKLDGSPKRAKRTLSLRKMRQRMVAKIRAH